MRSLRTKLVMIMVILILALMCVIGAFLINGVGNFYISQFYEQMGKTFSPDFIGQLQTIPAQEQSAPVSRQKSASSLGSFAAGSSGSSAPSPFPALRRTAQ